MPTIIDMSLKKVELNDWQFIQVISHIVWCEQNQYNSLKMLYNLESFY